MKGRTPRGTIYWDRSSKGDRRRTYREHSCWRAEISIARKRYRARFHDYASAEMWLAAMRGRSEVVRVEEKGGAR